MAADIASLWTTWIDLLEAHGFAVRTMLEPGAAEWEQGRFEIETEDEETRYYDLPFLRGEAD